MYCSLSWHVQRRQSGIILNIALNTKALDLRSSLCEIEIPMFVVDSSATTALK